jgi:hypothetical protein
VKRTWAAKEAEEVSSAIDATRIRQLVSVFIGKPPFECLKCAIMPKLPIIE